jgi:HSP20 family protein
MSNVTIQKVNGGEARLPIFEELAQRFGEVRQRAFDLFEERGRQIGREVEDWLRAEREVLGPAASEFAEKDDAYEVRVALPGFEVKDVSVTATPEGLIVHAATKQEKKSEKGQVIWTEFASNDVYRRFVTPNPIDVDRTKATLDKGVLLITVPKAAQPKEKAIAVSAG